MTDNARLENVPPSYELVRISNHALKRNDRSKFLEKLKQTIPTKWGKSCGNDGSKHTTLFLRLFQNLRYLSPFCVIILMEYFALYMLNKCYWILINYFFNQSLALQFPCITKTFRRQVCFSITLHLVSVRK